MLQRRIAIYEAEGIATLPEASFDVVEAESSRAKLSMGSALTQERLWLAECGVLGGSILGALFTPGLTRPANEREFNTRVHDLCNRSPIYAGRVYWVVEDSTTLPDDSYGATNWYGNAGSCLTNISDHEQALRVRKTFVSAASGWALVAEQNWSTGTKLVGEFTIAQDDCQRRIYPILLSMSAEGMVQGHATVERLCAAQQVIVGMKTKPELNGVCRLLTESVRREAHPLESFLAAWTGLEILVGKMFPYYEHRFMEAMSSGGASGTIVVRINEIMKGKYRLLDKFSLIAANLVDSDAEADVTRFKAIKDQRDKYFHTMNSTPDTLPTAAATELLRKYLRLVLQSG